MRKKYYFYNSLITIFFFFYLFSPLVGTELALEFKYNLISYIIIWCPTQSTGFALYALPGILLHRNYHICCKLQASGVAWQLNACQIIVNQLLYWFKKNLWNTTSLFWNFLIEISYEKYMQFTTGTLDQHIQIST